MNNTILYFGLILLMSGCCNLENVMKPTYNNGGYTLDRYTNKSLLEKDSAVISGKITALKGNESLIPSTIKLGDVFHKTSSGTYKLKVRPSEAKRHLTAISIGYLSIEAEPFVTQPGDSIVVNFYLVQDERPLY